MDWADDMAYSVHDLEDFHRCNALPWQRVFEDRDTIIEHALDRNADETSMSALRDAAESGAGQRQPRERKSTWKGVLLVLGALMAACWVFNVYDQLTSKAANETPPATEADPTGEPITLASVLRDYKTADAASERAAGGLERNTGAL